MKRHVNVELLLFVLLAAVPAAHAQVSGYSYTRAITINYLQVPGGPLTNFPVLFPGTYSSLATVANGGHVRSSSGYDIVFSSDALGQVIFWVSLPSLSSTANTTIYIWYGNPKSTTFQSTSAAVWDSNFTGDWHFATGPALSLTDSTSNGNNFASNTS